MNKPGQSARIDASGRACLCLLPAALFFFWRSRTARAALRRTAFVWIVLFSATTLVLLGCGGGGDPSLRYTPPGTYQYRITASSTNGVLMSQSVTLNITVTTR